VKEKNPPGNKKETERKRERQLFFSLGYIMFQFSPLNDYNVCWDCKFLPLVLLCYMMSVQ